MGEILVKCALARSRKGKRLIFLKLDVGVKWQHSELRDASVSLWKSYLFFGTD